MGRLQSPTAEGEQGKAKEKVEIGRKAENKHMQRRNHGIVWVGKDLKDHVFHT